MPISISPPGAAAVDGGESTLSALEVMKERIAAAKGLAASDKPKATQMLKGIVQESNAAASADGVSKAGRGAWHLRASMASFVLYERKLGGLDDAVDSSNSIKKAVELAPQDFEIAMAAARSLRALTSLPWVARGYVTRKLEIPDLKSAAVDGARLLAPFKTNAVAQYLRVELATFGANEAELNDANAKLTALGPDAVARAKAALEGDAKRAAAAAG